MAPVTNGSLWCATAPTATAVPFAIHLHTTRSDGTGTVDAIAADAASAGMKAIVVTDHGDGTGRREPPAYRSGVLVIDAVDVVRGDVLVLDAGDRVPADATVISDPGPAGLLVDTSLLTGESAAVHLGAGDALHAGTFGPNALDPTFGPEAKFVGIPPGMKPNRPPSDGFQFFGTLKADARRRTLTAQLMDLSGKVLYSNELEPL